MKKAKMPSNLKIMQEVKLKPTAQIDRKQE